MDDWYAEWMRATPRCPLPFFSPGIGSCTMQCPQEKKFVFQNDTKGMRCVYQPDEKIQVPLVSIAPTVFEGWTIEDLTRVNPTGATDFTKEKDRFEQALAVAYANIDKQKKIDDAFRDLQSAENAKAESPSAYQTARTAYYTLIKGDTWLNEERERIAASEVAPEIQKYRDAVSAVNVRTREQQKTIDIVNGIKDKVLSLKDDFKYSVNTFGDQLEKVKIQLNMENRSREEAREETWSWIDIGLNVLLVAVLAYAIYSLTRRYFLSRRPRPIPTTTIRIPTYTPPVM